MKTTFAKHFMWGICALCVLTSSVLASPVVIGHRGYSALYPENTLPSLEEAAPYSWGCEIDIRRTIDGQYILMHDATVDRTTNGSGYVDQLTFSYIRSLDAGSWKSPQFAGTQVPTTIEAINTAIANDFKLCVEIKEGSVIASELVDLLTPYSNYIEVHSFDEGLLQDMSNLGGDFTYVLIGQGDLNSKITNLQPCIDKVSWYYPGINTSAIDTAHALNKEVYAWTVNNTAAAENLVDMGVDAILTDNPALIDETLNGGQGNPSVYPVKLKDGMLAHWAFDEGLTNPTTRTAVDSVNHNDATFVDNLSNIWKTGPNAKVGGSLQLDGSSDTSYPIATSDLTAPVESVTISAWVKLDRLPSQLNTSYGSIYDSSEDAYVLYLDKGKRELRMKVTANYNAYPAIPESMLDTSDWHHLVGVYDSGAGTAQMYLDGQLVDVVTGSSGNPIAGMLGSQIPTIGSSQGSNFFDGKLDELTIWNRPLGQAEIDYLYNQGEGRVMPAENVFVGAPAPVVRYRFEGNLLNSGTGGSDYNATLIDSPNGNLEFISGEEGNYALRSNNLGGGINGDSLDTGYQLTDTGAISFWCQLTENDESLTPLFKASDMGYNWEMVSYNSEGNQAVMFLITPECNVYAELDSPDTWSHFVVQWAKVDNQAVLSLFFNGELVDVSTGTWANPTMDLLLLNGILVADPGTTALDDFRIYDSLLTSDEIMAIYLQSEMPESVPEPSTATLLASIALLAWFLRRRKK